MSLSQRLPLWLNAALGSENHVTAVLGVLSEREYKRDVARNASRMSVVEQSDSSRQSLLHFLGKKNRDAPPSHVAHYAITAGSLVPHQDLNRYMDIVPYDRTRVVVYDGHLGVEHELRGRYLNASWVLERNGGKWWIATQAPVKRSAHTFLTALMQPIINPPSSEACRSRVKTVVQLTRNFEGGRRKADAYFPSEVGKSIVVTPDDGHPGIPLKVTLCGLRSIEEAHCIESIVSILPMVNPPLQDDESNASSSINVSVQENQTIIFKHLLYLSWPDHGIPEDHQSILSFVRLVEQTNRNTSESQLASSPQEIEFDPPIMVGCSAGIGRTGSFIAITSLLRSYGFLLPAVKPTQSSVLPSSALGPLPEELQVDRVAQEIDSLREQRTGMVQRPEQLVLVYEVLASVFGSQL